MAKKIKQFRYYQEGDSRNEPQYTMTSDSLEKGTFFADYVPISFLGIQALPGTKFYLNDSWDPIVIGYTGIFELSLNDLTEITSLRFDHNSLIDINQHKDTVLLIDIVYGEEEAV